MYTSLAANDFAVAIVSNNHFEPGAYTNITKAETSFLSTLTPAEQILYKTSLNNTNEIESFIRMLKGSNASATGYKDLSPSQCTELYKTEFMSSYRNLFLTVNHSSNVTYNSTVLWVTRIYARKEMSSGWMCRDSLRNISQGHEYMCDPSRVISGVKSGRPWQMDLGEVGVVEISGCKSEITKEKCKVHFSLGIMIVVICCNLVKAFCMVTVVVRSREPSLVTLGDALDSFLRIPDPTTRGICFADRVFIERLWRLGQRTGPRQWKQKGVQRWSISVSKTRWIACNLFCSISIVTAACLIKMGVKRDGGVWSTDLKSM